MSIKLNFQTFVFCEELWLHISWNVHQDGHRTKTTRGAARTVSKLAQLIEEKKNDYHYYNWILHSAILNYINCVLWISALCRGLITKTGACHAVRFINKTHSSVLSHGTCISPEVCDCLRPHPEPNYFYPDGPYCKRT